MSTRSETEDRAAVNKKNVVASETMPWPTNISIQTAGKISHPARSSASHLPSLPVAQESYEKTIQKITLPVDKTATISTSKPPTTPRERCEAADWWFIHGELSSATRRGVVGWAV